jgi:hypothetical protein
MEKVFVVLERMRDWFAEGRRRRGLQTLFIYAEYA